MALLLKYDGETGRILGAWESNNLVVLEAQRVPDDAVHGYLLCTEPVDANMVEATYQVMHGMLVARPTSTEDQ